MNSGKNRSTLLAVVAAYLLYTAWELFQGRNDPGSSMAPALAVVFAVLFAAVAAALLIYAGKVWKQAGQEKEEPVHQDSENSLK